MLGATAPANFLDEGLVPFPLPPRACPCFGISLFPMRRDPARLQAGEAAASAAAAWGHWGASGFGGFSLERLSFLLAHVCVPLGLTRLSSLLPALPKEGLPKEGLPRGQPPAGVPPGLPPT